jgi:carboxyl-terminal processing protease
MLKFMKNKILIPCLIIGALAAVVSFRYSGQGSHSSEDKRKLVLQSVMETIKSGHFSPKALDDTFSSRVYKMIVREFNYEKLFFTRQDMKMLSSYEFKLDDEIAANSIEFFDSLDAVFLRRLKGAQQLDSEILKKPFTFDGNEIFQENYDKQEYARDDNELPAKWHDFIKLQVLVRYVDLKKDQEKKRENKDSVNAKFKTDAELEVDARDGARKYIDRFFSFYKKQKDDERFAEYINAITETEDPHTNYFPPADKSDFDVTMSGAFVGIGARLSPENDKVTVSSIIIGSPSWKQGELKEKDEITKVAQGDEQPVDVGGYELNDVVKLIRGPKGTIVKLTVKRADGSTKVIPIKRDVIEIEETYAKSAVIKSKDGPIGYIYLPEFYADFNHTSGRNCSTDIAVEVKKLKEAGVTGIILDLRGNGGGSLGDVVDMAGLFTGKGPVVQVKSNHAAPAVLPAQPSDGVLYTGPMAIMVNEGSASASEIMAAAMQDYKRAVIIGSTTYGKGTVQKMVDLDQFVDPMTRLRMTNDTAGSMGKSLGSVKLTMEKFYRVNGGSTQMKGVTPDITIPDARDAYDEEDQGERHNKSALPWDVIPPANYKVTNSVGNLQQLAALSKSRIANNETFKLIQENSEYFKKKRDENVASLNEKRYRKEQDEINEKSKKMEELQKKAVLLEITNTPADEEKLADNAKKFNDTTAISKNKDWLKNVSKDIYISEVVNVINDLKKSGVTMNMEAGKKD